MTQGDKSYDASKLRSATQERFKLLDMIVHHASAVVFVVNTRSRMARKEIRAARAAESVLGPMFPASEDAPIAHASGLNRSTRKRTQP